MYSRQEENELSPAWLGGAMEETAARTALLAEAAQAERTLGGAVGEALASPGKMYRPLLLLLCAGPPERWRSRDETLSLAAAVELTHSASLIHDDIVDDAPIRRGRPTVQSRYGKHAAVYAGDYLLSATLCDLIARGYSLAAGELLGCVKRMCEGEMAQTANRWDCGVGLEEYFKAISGKTAALFETACRLGARAGGRSEACVDALACFGRELGLLFQLGDDLNDWTLESSSAGKAVNMDFFGGIFTYPAIHTFSGEHGRELRELAERAGRGECSAELAQLARATARVAGGIESCAAEMARRRAAAETFLSRVPEDECTAAMVACLDRLCAEAPA